MFTHSHPNSAVTSVPSANWVLIMPDHTMLELCRGGVESDGESTGITTDNTTATTTATTTITTPESAEDDSPFHHSSQVSSITFPKDARSKSSTSGVSVESSVDDEYHSNSENWNLQSLLQSILPQRLFSMSMNKSGGAGIQESSHEEEREEEEVIQTEPGREYDKRFTKYPFQPSLKKEQTVGYKEMVHSELKDTFASSVCVRGTNLTPEPIISPRKGNEGGHRRMATWHSETEFGSKPPVEGKRQARKEGGHGHIRHKLTAYVLTPRMHAILRVQPHPIKGLRDNLPSTGNLPNQLWSHERVFDVYVHPSSLPEVYFYSQRRRTTSTSFLVELAPIPQPNKYVPKSAESATSASDATDGDGHGVKSKRPEVGLPASLVVRLCFATKVVVDGSGMLAHISDPARVRVSEAEEEEEAEEGAESLLEVPVKVGHVMMSDLVRQQLEIKECSKIKMMHVMDKWKLSFVDKIKVVLQPLYYNKVRKWRTLLWVGYGEHEANREGGT